MTSHNNYNRAYSSRRRASPTYNDYDEPSSESSTRHASSPGYNTVPDNRHENSRSSTYSHDGSNPNYNTNSYSNYRRPWRPWDDIQPSPDQNLNYHGHPSRSPPPPSSSQSQSTSAPSSSHRPSHRRRTASPEQPAAVARTEPTPEYLLTAETPSKQLDDPTSSRKLLVLDLNGCLLVRSPHRKPATLPRNAPYDPYAEPARPRALRSVHPRPYMNAFRDYLFHEETKSWLDTMVWSSAQPHSVADMVDKAFGDRKDELKAIWARDTLGLRSDQYNQKTQTTKDLAKPWTEVSALRPSGKSSSTHREFSPASHSLDELSVAEEVPQEDADALSHSHSAHTTLLMDDSPLKAILQPFNHLCMSEYTNDMRKKDLTTLEIQNLKRRRAEESQQASKPTEEQHAVTGSGNVPVPVINEDENSGNIPFEDVLKARAKDERASEQEKKERKMERKKRSQETKRKEKEDELLAKIAAMSGEKPVSSSSVASTENSSRSEANGLLDEAGFGYDSALLAAVGILEHIKHEDNVAAWMKSGGLIRIPGLEGVQREETKSVNEEASVSATKDNVTVGEGKFIPVVDNTVDIDLNQDSLNTTKSGSRRDHTPPSHDGTPAPTKKRRISNELEQLSSDSSKSNEAPATDIAPQEQLASGTTLGHVVAVPADDLVSSETQWFENHVVLAYWAEKGRSTLLKLGITVQSGVAG